MPINSLQKLIRETINQAIEAKTECFITFEDNGVVFHSYRYATERHSILRYTSSFQLHDDKMFLDYFMVFNDKEPVEQGAIIIHWDRIRQCTINCEGDRSLIKIDGMEINFLEPIKIL